MLFFSLSWLITACCIATISAIVGAAATGVAGYDPALYALVPAILVFAGTWLCIPLPLPGSRRLTLVLTAVGFTVRLMPILWIANEQVSDFQVYHELAASVSEGHGLAYAGSTGLDEDVSLYLHQASANGPVTTAFRPPGLPAVLGATYLITGPNSTAGKLLNAVLGTVGGLCLFAALRPTNVRLAFTSALLWLTYPTSILATNLLGTEVLFASTVLATAYLMARSLSPESREGSARAFGLCAGIGVGLACLVRPAPQLLVAAMFTPLFLRVPRRRPAFGTVLIVLAFTAVVSIWAIRNQLTFGVFQWQPTNVGQELYRRSTPLTESVPDVATAEESRVMETSQDEFVLDRTGRELAWRRVIFAVTHPLLSSIVTKIVGNHVKGWRHDLDVLRWVSVSSFGQTPRRLSARPVSERVYGVLATTVMAAYVSVFVLACFGCYRFLGIADNGAVLMLTLFALANWWLFALFTPQARLHFDTMPLICILAAGSNGMLGNRGGLAPADRLQSSRLA